MAPLYREGEEKAKRAGRAGRVSRTILVGDRSKLHPVLVFLSVLGGIKGFGMIGLVAGPLGVAIGRPMLDMYRLEKTGSLGIPSASKR